MFNEVAFSSGEHVGMRGVPAQDILSLGTLELMSGQRQNLSSLGRPMGVLLRLLSIPKTPGRRDIFVQPRSIFFFCREMFFTQNANIVIMGDIFSPHIRREDLLLEEGNLLFP